MPSSLFDRDIPPSNFPQLPAVWLAAPDERSPNFLLAFTRISIALQQSLRAHIPAAYFENLENFRDTKRAYPMLVYQASRPFRARIRTELTYDVLNPETLERVFRSAKQCLPELLASTERPLAELGWTDVARSYRPKHSTDLVEAVQRLSKSRRCLYVLIRSENALMNALIDLAGLGSLTPKAQLKRTTLFEKRWTFELRRLYSGIDCLGLAPLLLERATAALQNFRAQLPDSSAEPPAGYST